MKRALLWSVLFIPLLINSNAQVFLWGCGVVFSWVILKRKAWIFIGLSACVFLNLNFKTFLPFLSSSLIVELNDNSFVVSSLKGKVLVLTQSVNHYNLLDEITLSKSEALESTPSTYGFDQNTYRQVNGIIGKSNEEDILSHHPNPWMNFIGLGGFNSNPDFRKISRAILFQSDPNNTLLSVISLGLIYSMILKIGQSILSFFIKEDLSKIVMIILFSGIAVYFAYPISLIRVLISSFLTLIFKHKSEQLIGFVVFFMVYDVASFRTIAILYPLLFQVFAVFKTDRTSRFSYISFLLYGFFHKVALGLVLLYPLLRKCFELLVGLVWLGYFLSFLNPLIIWFNHILQTFITLLQSNMIIRGTLSGASIALWCFILILVYFFKLKTKFLWLCLVLCVPLLSVPWFYQVTFISVGQGDAILLQAPFNQEIILIDTGKESAYSQLQSFLDAQAISRIDTLIITHSDTDHSGNWANLLRDYTIERSLSEAKSLQLKWFGLNSLKTELIEPDDNQASLVFHLTINHIRFLLMADADEMTETDLLRQYPNLKADILKIGHHGSASSSSEAFLSRIQAKLAIISVGPNTYGHPSWKTLDRLAAIHVPVMTTQNEGDISFVFTEFSTILKTSSLKLKQLVLGF